MSNTLPPRRRPEACHVCGRAEGTHVTTGHLYWSNADAFAEAAAHDARTVVRDSSAAYVAEHRPY